MRFTKMHGAGNDYVYVDCFRESVPDDPAELARQIADRHFGVGGDGLILIGPSPTADARMRMFNADGSEAEMCGNGIRCVAKYAYDHAICKRPTLRIETGTGVLAVELEIVEGLVERVRVDMGRPILEAGKIPVDARLGQADGRVVNSPLAAFSIAGAPTDWMDRCGLDRRMTCVSMGNPHVVLYCENVSAVPLAAVGPAVETQPIFPKRINVHFVEVHSPAEVTMRTWERGSGVTLACGTGASAVCVAGVLARRTDRRILAHLPGGDLELEWADNDHVYMTGPAVEVFSGNWSPPVPAPART
jgi:diaminopimelate epimerase